MRRLRGLTKQTFDSLQVRNFRLFYFGQSISLSGTWMQQVAQAWLVLQLTESGTALGITVALQFLPMLVGGAYGGLIADRADKQKLLIGAQFVAALLSGVLGILTLTGAVRLWMVYLMAFLLGLVAAVEVPTRQSFIQEMVGPDLIANAVALNSTLMNLTRITGPAIGGILIAGVGIGWCFVINAVSYVAVIAALAMMDRRKLDRTAPAEAGPGQLRAGLSYIWRSPGLRTPLLMMVVLGTFAYNFFVVIPVLAKVNFHADAKGLAWLLSAHGGGAAVGALVAAARNRGSQRAMSAAAAGLGALMIAVALVPFYAGVLIVMIPLGAMSGIFIASANATLQTTARPDMRGRVMALFAIALVGSTPIGGPITGWASQHFGARFALAFGGVAALATAGFGFGALRSSKGPVTGTPGHAEAPSVLSGMPRPAASDTRRSEVVA